MWDTAKGSCQAVLRGHDASTRWAELIGGGRELLTASADGMVKRWDLQGVTCKQTSPGEWLAWVAFQALSPSFHSHVIVTGQALFI